MSIECIDCSIADCPLKEVRSKKIIYLTSSNFPTREHKNKKGSSPSSKEYKVCAVCDDALDPYNHLVVAPIKED